MISDKYRVLLQSKLGRANAKVLSICFSSITYALLDSWIMAVTALKLCPLRVALTVSAGSQPQPSILLPMMQNYKLNYFSKKSRFVKSANPNPDSKRKLSSKAKVSNEDMKLK